MSLSLFLCDSGSGLEKMELDRLVMVDSIKGYKGKSVRHSTSHL